MPTNQHNAADAATVGALLIWIVSHAPIINAMLQMALLLLGIGSAVLALVARARRP